MNQTQLTLGDLVGELEASIALLLEALQPMSAMILLYSAVDLLGALDSDDGVATRDTFIDWASRYIDPAGALGCSGLDLYSARCGLLHNRSPTSRLTRAGDAREFIYAIDQPLSPPKQSPRGPVIVYPPWLWVSFRDGASRFVTEVTNDGSRSLRVNKNLEDVYFERTL
jgi:hypothetical protein